jgi:hypothetical protein
MIRADESRKLLVVYGGSIHPESMNENAMCWLCICKRVLGA